MNRLEEAYETAKDYAFSIMKETMAQFMCSPLIYKLFVLLELMQMVILTLNISYTTLCTLKSASSLKSSSLSTSNR